LSISRTNDEEIDRGVAIVGRHLSALAAESRVEVPEGARPYI
jgi:hypothetical protein